MAVSGHGDGVTEIPGCDEPLVSEEPRVLDAHGRAVSALDRYRARQKLAEAEQYDEGDTIEADLARQIEVDGYRWERTPSLGAGLGTGRGVDRRAGLNGEQPGTPKAAGR